MKFLLFGFGIFVLGPGLWLQPARLILHAHNDYEKEDPLVGALNHGITQIEADIFLFRGRLVVSHIPFRLESKPSLDELYFKPLERMQQEKRLGGPSGKKICLVIDMKHADPAVMDSLRALVIRKKSLCVGEEAAVRIILSGGAGRHLLRAEDTLYFGLDDNLMALWEAKHPPDRYTRQASMSWNAFRNRYLQNCSGKDCDSIVRNITGWFKEKAIPLRLYAAGNRPRHWKRLADWGFTVINVDRYARAARWLKKYQRLTLQTQ
ncbi:MAG: hypothetical protein NZM15_05715 [Flavobacteriales bacterium]|nr:hypothetical protein [Flavobacteriales bacterium]MDW8432181.1 hypothetical protein [Flavobacteriales bacterium]